MKQIALLSDTHGRCELIDEAVGIIKSRGIDTFIHCGDVDYSLVIPLFDGLHGHFVHGNCDIEALEEVVKSFGHDFYGILGTLEIEGVKIGFTHGHAFNYNDDEAVSQWNVFCYGHTHEPIYEITSLGTVRVNPGAFTHCKPGPMFRILTIDNGKVTVENALLNGK